MNMIIQIAPVLLGSGIPLFSQKEELKRFFLTEYIERNNDNFYITIPTLIITHEKWKM